MLRADELAPGDLFEALWRWRRLAVAAALVCGALGYGYSLFLPDQYTAGTLVLVEEWQLPQNYVQSTATLNLGARLRTLSKQILSRSRLNELMTRHRLFGDPADPVEREKMLAALTKRITVEVGGGDSFRISFRHEDPDVAAAVANELAGFFIDDSRRALEHQVENTNSALQAQRERVKAALDQKEREIRDFKSQNMGMLPEQLSANLETLDRLQQQLTDNSSRLASARSRKAQLEAEALRGISAGGTILSARERAQQLLQDPTTTDLSVRLPSEPPRVRLEVLRLQREALLRRFTRRHPDVQALDLQIAALEQEIAEAPETPVRGVASAVDAAPPLVAEQIRDAEREIRDLLAERKSIQEQMRAYEQRIERAPAVEQAMRELEREYNAMLQEYQGLVRRSMEAELAGDLQRSGPFARFRVIDPAVPPQVPSGPLRVLFLAGGMLLGLGLLCAGVLAVEMVFEPIRSAAEVRKYAGLEVLATIPLIETRRLRRQRRRQGMATWAAVASVLAVVFVLRLLMRP